MRKWWDSKGAAWGEAIILLALGGLMAYLKPVIGIPLLLVLLAFGIYLIWRSYKRYSIEPIRDDGTTLFRLLDESYQRLKYITGKAIDKLRNNEWKGVDVTSTSLAGLTQIDMISEIQDIRNKGIMDFLSGKPLTIIQDAEKLGDEIKKSPLFTTSPEIIAKDASIALRDNIPYLDKAMGHDSKYKKLLQEIERECDKYPSQVVSDKVDAYLDHSIQLNATWVYAERDLEFLEDLQDSVGSQFPTQFMLFLKNIPNQMDVEMGRYRNEVAMAIADYLKGVNL